MTATALPPARLLLVDDDEEACRLLAEVLERESYDVVPALSADEALTKVHDAGPFDAVLTDLRMPGKSGLDLLRTLRERDPGALVLVLTAFGDAGAAGEAIRAGAYDFISKPYDITALRETLARSLGRRRLAGVRRDHGAAANGEGVAAEPALVGHSPAIIEVMKTLARVSPSQATVLVLGETGTGKELVARTIHHFSERADRRFVAVNCSALAEGLLESELFGHIRGAFTGAGTARPGLFREADHGTLFLDEIGDISPALQARLLRALQEHEIVPVGSESPVRVDVRVLAATHRDLPELVRQGRFREDLYYRLNVVTLTLPPLRARPQDIPLLIDHFLRELAVRHGRGPVAVDPEAQRRLLAYDWPGNIRELQNVLERAILLAEQDVIGPEHLPPDVRSPRAVVVPAGETAPGDAAPLRSLDEVDREHVLRVLRAMRGNRDETSRVLGISRRTLSRMILRWNLPRRFE
ncbi:MAG TPA: sigma-54 dependent transcriptional regulator [Gemmatimonadales bacterium]|jgi:DNA-binding NtrC family response regulator|nr:sigma-54 dependent transcriptional regulator [Gemmatimonadales bacterium]